MGDAGAPTAGAVSVSNGCGSESQAVPAVQVAQCAGVGRLAILDVEDVAVVTGRCREPDRTRQTLIEKAVGKPPAECRVLATIDTARFDPDVVVENRVDGMASRLTGRLHRRHPGERLVPRSREHHRVVVYLVAAVAGLPDVALLEIFAPASPRVVPISRTFRVDSTGRCRADCSSLRRWERGTGFRSG